MNSLPVDILIFAVIAGLIFHRYIRILGSKDEDDSRSKNMHADHLAKVIMFPGGEVNEDQTPPSALTLSQTLDLIARKDPDFDEAYFIQGAKTAFKMIVMAFTKGDMVSVSQFLSGPVMRKFKTAIKDREPGIELQLEKINHAQIVDASITGSLAQITVQFTSEQTLIQSKKNQETQEVTDLWTFSKSVYAHDSIWVLIDIMPAVLDASENL